MRSLIYTCFFFLALLICTSCSNRQYQALFEQKNSISDTLAQKNITGIAYYRIKPQDILQIRNLQNSKNIVDMNPATGTASVQGSISAATETFLVENDGTIALAGLGHVQVAGLTRIEAQTFVEGLYHKVLLKEPLIELKIINLKVTLLGEVRLQGDIPITKDHTTLIEVISMAGGLTEKANETNIKIIRGTQRNPQVIVVDLSDIRSINDPKAVLQSGDIIYVTQNNRAIRNDKIQNFSSIFQPALLLFNTALIIITLVRH